MKRAKVTFFMIAYNEEKWIRRAIQSVLDQTEPDVELYVRNNGSTDRTGDVVREMAGRDGRVHLVENKKNWKKDNGKEFINEKGSVDIWPVSRETLGDYVAFLDADDQLYPDFAEKLLNAAEKNHAEIAVCGCTFLQNGQIPLGERLPPALTLHTEDAWSSALRGHEVFVQLYNVFRTWWGKLFQREFFLKYYDEAWQSIGGPHGTTLDTAFMLRYLRSCTRLACVTMPLYYFTTGANSTYSNWIDCSGVYRALQSEALFDEGAALLERKNAKTAQNVAFLYQLNWAFCWEALEGLRYLKEPKAEHLNRVIDLLNNRVAAGYLASSSDMICKQLEPVFQTILERNADQMEQLYLRYPIRLMYARKLFQANPASELLPLLITAVLSDVENHHGLGEDLLPMVAKHHQGLAASLQYVGKNWAKRHDNLHNFWVAQIQVIDEWETGSTEALAQSLREAFDESRYDEASGLLCELSRKSPLHRDGVFYRIQLAELIGEHELAVVLAASARVLFGLDAEMQGLCWCVLNQGG